MDTPKTISRAEHILQWISYLLRVSVLVALGLSLLFGQWLTAFECLLIFISFNLPALLERNLEIKLPTEFELSITLFLYASLFLGSVQNFYGMFWWWDGFLHTISGFILGFAGFLILYSLYRLKRFSMSAFLLSMFSFCFAIALGTLWEIFEFGLDQIFGMNMQESGIVDTMWDLIVDSLGALLASVLGYLYVKYKRSPLGFFDQLLRRFLSHNRQHFFHKKKPKGRA